jgi:cytoskeletal protein RodZ
MKLDLNLLHKRRNSDERRAPRHLFGGRVRTSTLVLIVVFFALWWTYGTYGPHSQPHSNTPPPSQVVPPGFVPDPDYTWVPRTRLQQSPATRPTPTPTPTTTTPPPTTTTTTTTSPPGLPCLLPPPFCPPSSSPTPTPTTPSQQPLPGLAPAPGPTAPAR